MDETRRTTINVGIGAEKNICFATVKGGSRLTLMENELYRTVLGTKSFA
jgi:hypothetical protein